MDPGFTALPLAHRGLHDRGRGVIENSRGAVGAAIDAGYGIEIDVQLSADGEAMVFHDEALRRLTGADGLVRDRDAAALCRLELKGGGETIPTLTEVLALVAGRVPILIEVKDQDGALGPDVGPLERRVGALVSAYAGPVAVMSFNPHAVAALAVAAPGVARGLTTDAFTAAGWPAVPPVRRARCAAMEDFARVGASFISHDFKALDSAPVAALKAKGVPVLCWTIRSERDEARARRIADGITFEGYRATLPDRSG